MSSDSAGSTVVVVGASVGGVRTVQALRAEGFDGDLLLVGAETHLLYDKPPLSKDVLLAGTQLDEIELISTGELEKLDVSVLLGSAAIALDPGARLVRLGNGDALHYDDVVIATGASARPAPWDLQSGIHLLRTWEDASALRAELVPGRRVVVIGGGLIGSEVAIAARANDCDVVMIDVDRQPLARSFGPQLATRLTRLHNDRGITTYLGAGVRSVEGDDSDFVITLDEGTKLKAQTVVAGLGCVPNTGWLESSGLLLDNGIVCDSTLQAAPHVYAVGDVARWPHPSRGGTVRVEHWSNAVDQARFVARVIVGQSEVTRFEPSEYVWTDQFDWKLKAVGAPVTGGTTTVVGDLNADRPVVAAIHADAAGMLCGGVAVNWPAALARLRRQLANGQVAASEFVGILRQH